MGAVSKIAFVVLSGPNGKGGHHYSIRDLGREFESQGVEVHYVTLVNDESINVVPLAGNSNLSKFAISFNLLKLLRFLRRQIQIENFDAVLSLDEVGVRFCLAAFPNNHHKVIAVKPGWINSKAWTANAGSLVCFSRENFDFFKNTRRYETANLQFIPQRVSEVEERDDLVKELAEELDLKSYDKVIIAGGRIDIGDGDSPGKKPIFESSVVLHEELLRRGVSSILIIAGTPKNARAKGWIEALANRTKNTHLEMRERYTKNLSSLFVLADYAVAMGRVAMEAMSLSKIVFVPTASGGLPIRITKENFETVAYFNFTQRAGSKLDISHQGKVDDLGRLLAGNEFESKQGVLARELFVEHLSVKTGVDRYIEVIRGLGQHERRSGYSLAAFSFMRIFLVMIRGALQSIRSK